MRFCCRLAWVLGSAAALYGAAPGGTPPSGAVTSVVRVDRRTGKLVRKVASQNPVGIQTPSFKATVERIAAEQSLPPELIHSVIKVESNYDPFAVSSKGARGLMQLVPSTARRFGVEDAFDPAENIRGGAKYLKYLLSLYSGDPIRALAAYNAGEGAVMRYGGIPPFPETRQYVSAVQQAVRLAAPPAPAADAAAPETRAATPVAPPPGGNHIREVVGADGSVRYVSQ